MSTATLMVAIYHTVRNCRKHHVQFYVMVVKFCRRPWKTKPRIKIALSCCRSATQIFNAYLKFHPLCKDSSLTNRQHQIYEISQFHKIATWQRSEMTKYHSADVNWLINKLIAFANGICSEAFVDDLNSQIRKQIAALKNLLIYGENWNASLFSKAYFALFWTWKDFEIQKSARVSNIQATTIYNFWNPLWTSVTDV